MSMLATNRIKWMFEIKYVLYHCRKRRKCILSVVIKSNILNEHLQQWRYLWNIMFNRRAWTSGMIVACQYEWQAWISQADISDTCKSIYPPGAHIRSELSLERCFLSAKRIFLKKTLSYIRSQMKPEIDTKQSGSSK